MKFPGTFLACLTALTLSGTAWAQIYESKDAEGNPIFTDTPGAGAKEVDLSESNIADALKESPHDTPAPGGGEDRSTATIIDNDPDARRERGDEGRHEVLDTEERHEVLDAEPRHEVGDDEEMHPAYNGEH
ncbi:MAG: DUF4124 domain-containing protein [Halioglobus sp.]